MSAHIDVEGPIRATLRDAERKFDAKILELAPADRRESVRAVQVSPGAYALGLLSAAFQDAVECFAQAFAAGQHDYRNGGRS